MVRCVIINLGVCIEPILVRVIERIVIGCSGGGGCRDTVSVIVLFLIVVIVKGIAILGICVKPVLVV